MSVHFREECTHGTVGAQCRCPGDKHVKLLLLCPDQCPFKGTPTGAKYPPPGVITNHARPSEHRYEPDLVYPPGDTLVEVLGAAEMTQAELAVRTGLSTKHVNQIVKGAASITPETAMLLERATGVPARTWSNLEFAYREHLLKRISP